MDNNMCAVFVSSFENFTSGSRVNDSLSAPDVFTLSAQVG